MPIERLNQANEEKNQSDRAEDESLPQHESEGITVETGEERLEDAFEKRLLTPLPKEEAIQKFWDTSLSVSSQRRFDKRKKQVPEVMRPVRKLIEKWGREKLVDDITAKLNEGKSLREIEFDYGCDHITLRALMGELAINRPSPYGGWPGAGKERKKRRDHSQ